MDEDYDLYGETEMYIDGTRVGKVQDVQYKIEPIKETPMEKESREALARFQKKLTTGLAIPAEHLYGTSFNTNKRTSSHTFNLGGASQSLMDALQNSYRNPNQSQESLMAEATESMKEFAKKYGTKLRKPEEYALEVTDLISDFSTKILMEIREAILLRHAELEINDFVEFRTCFKSTGCVVRRMTSLSPDLSHLKVIDSSGFEIIVQDTGSEFKLSDGTYLVIKY